MDLNRKKFLAGMGAGAFGLLMPPGAPVASSSEGPKRVSDPAYTTLHPSLIGFDANPLIRPRSPEDVAAKRRELAEYVWPGGGLPAFGEPEREVLGIADPRYTDGSMPALERLDKLVFLSRDRWAVHSSAYLFKTTSRAPNGLLVYQAGHVPTGFHPWKPNVLYFLRRGYDVLAYSMPLQGDNRTFKADLGHLGSVPMNNWHDSFRLLEEDGFRPVKFFLEPVIRGITHALEKERYPRVVMTGYSGGGWTTGLVAALDTRVERSYPTAGMMPHYCKTLAPNNQTDFGDYEQNVPGLYRVAGWPELYVMGACPDPGGGPRRQVEIHNLYDPVTCAGVNHRSYSTTVGERASAMGGSWAHLTDDTHYEHKISDWAREWIARDLNS